MPKTIYICHPFTTHGNAAENFEAQTALGQAVFNAGHIPVSPILAFGKVIPHDPANYDRAMASCLWLMSKCDEVWVFGNWTESTGCKMEVAKAADLGITTRDGKTALIQK